jgi:hypothetical protein
MEAAQEIKVTDTDTRHARLPDGQGHRFEPEVLAYCCEH